ncbi:hypothetical protein [Burkholderia gladioli]|uniref:hypothetical protein n=1 Tax=Burkholderia gladioli TaxID=28095 RepID=UPI0012F793D2|nr:hypothetical protein [Burkholderia gladioli]
MSDNWTTPLTLGETTQQLRANARTADDGMLVAPPEWWAELVVATKIRTPRQRMSQSRKRLGMHVLPDL